MSDGYYVQTAATVIASGSQAVTLNYFGTQEIALIVNVGTVTGAGSIQYTIQELDPGDGVTTYGNSATTSVITSGNAPGVFTAVLNVTTSPSVKITWTVTGTFSATIYATISTKNTPSTQTINGTISATNPSVGTDGAAALGFDTQVGGITTTNAPTYTTGNLDALSLTTRGGLRIDGVYPTAAAPLSTDAMYVAGAVTTAAPTYTTGQMDPLSLTTLGGLRIDGVYAQGTANATAADVSVAGGYVTTTAPTYTTGQLNPLSLDTSGNLRVTGFVTTNKSTTAAITSVAVTASAATTLLTANANRIFASIYNATNKNMYIALGSTASTSNYSILLITGSYWELPVDWTGSVSEFSPSGASGNALCTELTP
jgi:hypothetical protein